MYFSSSVSFLSFPRSFYPNTMCFCFLWVSSSVFFTNISSFIWNTQLQISLMYLFLKCSLFCEAWPYPAVRNTYSLSEYPLNWHVSPKVLFAFFIFTITYTSTHLGIPHKAYCYGAFYTADVSHILVGWRSRVNYCCRPVALHLHYFSIYLLRWFLFCH